MEYFVSLLVWISIISLPLFFTFNDNYKKIFPHDWYDLEPRDSWNNPEYPSPLGLSLGLLAVVIGQICVLIYFKFRTEGRLGTIKAIQKEGAPKYEYFEGLTTHLAQPEGFILLGGYLIGTWMFGLMSPSYYSFSGGINLLHVAIQLLIQDSIQTGMHLLEHIFHPKFYQYSHKPHHRFTNPRMFDAFNGSVPDTICMILIPLFITQKLVPANVWSYMAFGSLYANWLTLIHSEYSHPWDPLFRSLSFGTAADHHVHHKLFTSNYGHLFMFWDKALGTYRNPTKVSSFNEDL